MLLGHPILCYAWYKYIPNINLQASARIVGCIGILNVISDRAIGVQVIRRLNYFWYQLNR